MHASAATCRERIIRRAGVGDADERGLEGARRRRGGGCEVATAVEGAGSAATGRDGCAARGAIEQAPRRRERHLVYRARQRSAARVCRQRCLGARSTTVRGVTTYIT